MCRGRLPVGGRQREQAQPRGAAQVSLADDRPQHGQDGLRDLGGEVEIVVVGLREHRGPQRGVQQEAAGVRCVGTEPGQQRVGGLRVDDA